jgi:hypothetical protein
MMERFLTKGNTMKTEKKKRRDKVVFSTEISPSVYQALREMCQYEGWKIGRLVERMIQKELTNYHYKLVPELDELKKDMN